MKTKVQLQLYNTLSRAKEPFVPIDATNIRLYVCGPTVYDDAHIGNARPLIVFDLLFRLLRFAFGEDHVRYARNITDLDDKINARALERWTGARPLTEEIRDLTDTTLARFRADCDGLGILPPSYEPRATDFISRGDGALDMVGMVAGLIEKGHAYAGEGHVLFSVPSMPHYGELARRASDEMIAGARIDVAPYKRDPMDFVLWKPSDAETEPGWDSPWGYGRPGWHIECSAMAGALLGEVFDIHAGGIDLIFPHHENEIAQTCCYSGLPRMANYWLHNGFLQVEGEKMSKSLGNFVTIRQLLEETTVGGRSWPGELLRLAMLKTQYRQPIDWTLKALEEAAAQWNSWRNLCAAAAAGAEPADAVVAALADDLNTPKALAELHRIKDPAILRASLLLLGFDVSAAALELPSGVTLKQIEDAIRANSEFREARNYVEADRVRDELARKGIVLNIKKDGTSWQIKP